MAQRHRDLATLAVAAPFVFATRTMQMATGTMSHAEWTRMWFEKPLAVANSVAEMQLELMRASTAQAMRNVTAANGGAAFGKAIRPFARAVDGNYRRLSR